MKLDNDSVGKIVEVKGRIGKIERVAKSYCSGRMEATVRFSDWSIGWYEGVSLTESDAEFVMEEPKFKVGDKVALTSDGREYVDGETYDEDEEIPEGMIGTVTEVNGINDFTMVFDIPEYTKVIPATERTIGGFYGSDLESA